MSFIIPDLVGFTSTLNHSEIVVADLNITNITQVVEDTLTAAGWTIISKTVGSLGFFEYEFYSAQSPWYDSSNIPAWYTGGRVWLKITHYSVTSGGWTNKGFFFQVGEYYNGAAVNKSASNFWVNYGDWGYSMHVWANPHEFRFWGSEDQEIAPIPGQPNVLMYSRNFYCSAMNIPRPILQKQRAITSIVAQGYRTVGQQYFYYCWRTRDVLYCNVHTNDGNNLEGLFPPTTHIITDNAAWIPSVDVGMATRKLRPFLIPPFIRYRPIELAGAIDDISRIWGFLWDTCFIYSPFLSSYQTSTVTKGTTMVMAEKTFLAYTKTPVLTSAKYPSTWLRIS